MRSAHRARESAMAAARGTTAQALVKTAISTHASLRAVDWQSSCLLVCAIGRKGGFVHSARLSSFVIVLAVIALSSAAHAGSSCRGRVDLETITGPCLDGHGG